MTTGIFPEDVAGGVIYRDVDGNPTNPSNVQNAYPPLPAFTSSCLLSALPADCTARIEPRQINAIVSELVSFAECLDPDGNWDCSSLKNLCAAFAAWADIHVNLDLLFIGDEPPPNPIEDQLWWESDTGILFVWYDDGNTSQWVQVVAPNNINVDGVSIVGLGSVSDPYAVALVDCGSW